MNNASEFYNRILQWVGYRDKYHRAEIWIIGSEENWGKLHKLDCGKLFDRETYKNRFAEEVEYEIETDKFYAKTNELLKLVFSEITNNTILTTNFRPIGFKGQDLCNFLHICDKSYQEYENDLREIRLKLLSQIWISEPPTLAFCYVGGRPDITHDCKYFLNLVTNNDYDFVKDSIEHSKVGDFPFIKKLGNTIVHFLYHPSRTFGFNKNIEHLKRYKLV